MQLNNVCIVKNCTHGHWISENKQLFKVNQLYFCDCNFDLGLNNFKTSKNNLGNELLSVASLLNHYWKWTKTSSSDIYIYIEVIFLTGKRLYLLSKHPLTQCCGKVSKSWSIEVSIFVHCTDFSKSCSFIPSAAIFIFVDYEYWNTTSQYNVKAEITVVKFLFNAYEPVHEISNNVVCATSKASDQPAHTRSLIRPLLVPLISYEC